jgi:hypothetical protein
MPLMGSRVTASRRALIFVASTVLPAVLAFISVLAVWTEPVSSWIGQAAAVAGDVLPTGRRWAPPVARDGAPYFASWAEAVSWLVSSGVPAAVLIALVAARVAVRCVAGPRRFGRPLEIAAFIGWGVVAAAAWRFFWGLELDRLMAGKTHVPVCLGAAHVGAMWAGALAGCIWTVRRLGRGSHVGREQRCPRCGYGLGGLSPSSLCPECGQDPAVPPRSTFGARTGRWFKRYGLPIAAVLLLVAPYVSTLIASVLPDPWVGFIGRRLPTWW